MGAGGDSCGASNFYYLLTLLYSSCYCFSSPYSVENMMQSNPFRKRKEVDEETKSKRQSDFVDRVYAFFGFDFKEKTINLEATMEKIVSVETTVSEMFAFMKRVEQRQEETARRQEENLQQLRDEISSLKRTGARVL